MTTGRGPEAQAREGGGQHLHDGLLPGAVHLDFLKHLQEVLRLHSGSVGENTHAPVSPRSQCPGIPTSGPHCTAQPRAMTSRSQPSQRLQSRDCPPPQQGGWEARRSRASRTGAFQAGTASDRGMVGMWPRSLCPNTHVGHRVPVGEQEQLLGPWQPRTSEGHAVNSEPGTLGTLEEPWSPWQLGRVVLRKRPVSTTAPQQQPPRPHRRGPSAPHSPLCC